MPKLNRREFNKLAGATAVGTATFGSFAYAQGKGRCVIIGGGAGGATVAHHVKKAAPELDVTLIEVHKRYTTCFFSNLYLGGFRTFDSITHDYSGLVRLGVNVIHDLATGVDTAKKTVSLAGGGTVAYDKLVLSPGISFKWGQIEGYDPKASAVMPHAWQAGPQTRLLKAQLEAMPDGGVVVMSPPPNPYRCPPGPYERASMIAYYLKTKKPKSKLIIFDPKPKFSKMALFQEGWEQHYSDIIEWVPPDISGGGVKKVDPSTMTVITGDGEKTKAAVANIIPAQKAGTIAALAGCTKGDWCPIKPDSFASALVNDVYVLGDSSIATKMPKSGFSANSQAKVVANAVVAELAKKKRFPARFRNTCWSLISPNNGVKVGASYKAGADKVEVTSKFISKTGESEDVRKKTYEESLGWYAGITADMFAKG